MGSSITHTISRKRTNPCEKTTSDLTRKYKLVASLDDIRNIVKSSRKKEDLMKSMEQKYQSFCELWNNTYYESNKLHHENGLAPRCSELVMVTGAVLHCLVALEHSVITRKLSERSLKIIRVETSKNGRKFVGVRYPVDDAALMNLRMVMETLKTARCGASNIDLFVDESPGIIQNKSVEWLTSAPKTMKSFFNSTGKKAKRPVKTISPVGTQKKRNKKESIIPNKKQKFEKPKPITSFFTKQN